MIILDLIWVIPTDTFGVLLRHDQDIVHVDEFKDIAQATKFCNEVITNELGGFKMEITQQSTARANCIPFRTWTSACGCSR